MASLQSMRVRLVAYTHFEVPDFIEWSTDAEGAEALTEFAGRACYETWDKPNPHTATNASYLRHILEVGHNSLLEHSSVTFYMTGISRSCTHELIRHRHFSYSQLSQRYVDEDDFKVVPPPAIADDPDLVRIFKSAAEENKKAYKRLVEDLEEKFSAEPNALLRRKQIRQAARAVLPNATETRIVVTGNLRSWRHFIAMRATEYADVEIRNLAVECLRQLRELAPTLFDDFEIGTLSDGTEIATSPYAVE